MRVDWHEEGGMGRERAKEVLRIKQAKKTVKLDENEQNISFTIYRLKIKLHLVLA